MITNEEIVAAEREAHRAHARRQDAHRALLASPDDVYLQDAYGTAVRDDKRAATSWLRLLSGQRWEPLSNGVDPICGNGRMEFDARSRDLR